MPKPKSTKASTVPRTTKKGKPIGKPSLLAKLAKPTRNLSFTVVDRICNHVAMGVPLNTAAEAAGVSDSCLREWLRKGAALADCEPDALDEMQALYVELYCKVNIAAAEGVKKRIARINRAAKRGEWKADAWMLSVTDPVNFGKRHQHDHIHAHAHQHVHAQMEVDVDSLPPDVCFALYQQMKQRGQNVIQPSSPSQPLKENINADVPVRQPEESP